MIILIYTIDEDYNVLSYECNKTIIQIWINLS